MLNSWLAIISQLPLSRTEREVVRRFEQEPAGRSFLPVADILRTHKLVDESLELLSQGVAAHPGFTVARVVLARELLQKGLVEQAWRVLEESTVSLKDNLLAQKLRFKLALLLSREDVARTSSALLEQQQMLDPEVRRLAETLKAYGLAEARNKIIQEFNDRGTELSLPIPGSDTGATANGGGSSGRRSADLSRSASGGSSQDGDGERHLYMAAASGSGHTDPYGATRVDAAITSASEVFSDPALTGFHVVPLAEIFRPDGAADPSIGGQGEGSGVELDSTTLADIYARQGHFSKALSVYRRLLQMAPGNELLRRKVAELMQLDKERQDVELTVDPTLVDRLETVEIIDRQMRMLSHFLAKLT